MRVVKSWSYPPWSDHRESVVAIAQIMPQSDFGFVISREQYAGLSGAFHHLNSENAFLPATQNGLFDLRVHGLPQKAGGVNCSSTNAQVQ